jgi:hypothetical protein
MRARSRGPVPDRASSSSAHARRSAGCDALRFGSTALRRRGACIRVRLDAGDEPLGPFCVEAKPERDGLSSQAGRCLVDRCAELLGLLVRRCVCGSRAGRYPLLEGR